MGSSSNQNTAAAWDSIVAGGELSATVLMASGFVLAPEQNVRERYRVLRALGRGGMGQVLAVALAGSADQHTYALKVVARGIDPRDEAMLDPTELSAAHDQARLFAELLRQEAAKQDVVQRHGVSVARLFALVQLDDGSLGLRMDLARGQSLEAWIDEQKHAGEPTVADVGHAVRVTRKLVMQLRRLHELTDAGSPLGFVHSDIKPGNVFVDAVDPMDPVITLLDFGVATAGQMLVHGSEGGASGRKTLVLDRSGGTLGYAPPHHFTVRPTPLSDVFASLVMFFELIGMTSPWNTDGLEKELDPMRSMELRIRQGPQSLRALRPGLDVEAAEVFDAFFAREFAALVRLADDVERALTARDDAHRATTVARLRSLAREYGDKLDALAGQLGAGASSAIAVAGARMSGTPRASEPGRGEGARGSAPGRASGTRGREKEGSWGRWLGLFLLAGVAATGYATLARWRPWLERSIDARMRQALARDDAGTERTATADVPHTVDAAVRVAHGEISLSEIARAPLVVAPAAPTPEPRASDAAAGGPATDGAAATALATEPDAAAAPVAERCECVGPRAGVRVVARGGSLDGEVVLCETAQAVESEHDQARGEGMIQREVYEAFPTLGCHGPDEPYELSLRRRIVALGETVAVFVCQRAVHAQAPPTAATDLDVEVGESTWADASVLEVDASVRTVRTAPVETRRDASLPSALDAGTFARSVPDAGARALAQPALAARTAPVAVRPSPPRTPPPRPVPHVAPRVAPHAVPHVTRPRARPSAHAASRRRAPTRPRPHARPAPARRRGR